MASASRSSPLDGLELSSEEAERLSRAFREPEFRRLLGEYAAELADPSNRRQYEAEVTALERERGVDARFVHPEPGHVLRTSLDGARRGFVNVCGNALIGPPRCRPAPGPGRGHHWSLPYSLAPGREYAGRGGRYTVYDVVFHPDALRLARRHRPFRRMLDATALDAVEKQFGVELDRRNAQTLRGCGYKGTPEPAVIRSPLPGGPPARPREEEEEEGEEEGEEPGCRLPAFPYPTPYPAAPRAPAPQPPAPPPAAPAPTRPRYGISHRHHVDLQDYRCSRDSAPGPVPRELVVTIELPLLRSAAQAALDVSEKELRLESQQPAYRLRLALPYPVDDSRGAARFDKAKGQLVVTLPVVPPRRPPDDAIPVSPPAGSEGCVELAGTIRSPARVSPRGAEPVGPGGSEGQSQAAPAQWREGGAAGAWFPVGSPPAAPARQPTEPDTAHGGGRGPEGKTGGGGGGGGGPRRGASGGAGLAAGRARGAGEGPGPGGSREPTCPPVGAHQDEDRCTLIVPVARIQPQSLRGALTPRHYQLSFFTRDCTHYSCILRFPPENRLSLQEPAVSVSPSNAVIELAKAPESRGHWAKWYFGLNTRTLQERLFISEENVDGFLDDSLGSQIFEQSGPETQPLIEVLEVTDNKSRIHLKSGEVDGSCQLDEKGQRANNTGRDVPETKDDIKLQTNTENCRAVTDPVEEEHPRESNKPSELLGAAKEEEEDGSQTPYCVQCKSAGASLPIAGNPQLLEPNLELGVTKENQPVVSNNEQETLKEGSLMEERELDEDSTPSEPADISAVGQGPELSSIKETNMQDGSVQIINDHVTRCAVTFQNSLLYDLD
ncbi:protein kintoun [Tachyglossus aculeatus]|uniref:protein kintoun n=1 Tax=Tachyglossus aculeatus TaxID=9261 RepID=UPI0018F6FB44|nr:protein kintoun [Tachyglossus aculeatus]